MKTTSIAIGLLLLGAYTTHSEIIIASATGGYRSPLVAPSPAPTGGEYPDYVYSFAIPSETSFPVGGSYAPPVTNIAADVMLAEWSRTAEDNRTVIYTTEDAVTNFVAYNSTTSSIAPTVETGYGTLIANSSDLSLLWPETATATGLPVRVNAPAAWWLGPSRRDQGETFSIYGHNLMSGGTGYAYVDGYGWLTSTAGSQYKCTFTVPAGLLNGSYTVTAYNGVGGAYGWGESHTLVVADPIDYTGATNTVTAGSFSSLQSVLSAAPNGSTVIVPAGTYNFTTEIKFEAGTSNIWIQGAGPDQTKFVATGYEAGDPHRFMLDLQWSPNWKVTGISFDGGDTAIAMNMAGLFRLEQGGQVSDCLFTHVNCTNEVESSSFNEKAVSLGGTATYPMVVSNCVSRLSDHIQVLSYTDYSYCTNYGIGWSWLNSAIIRLSTGEARSIDINNCYGAAMEGGVNSANRWLVAQNAVFHDIYVGENTLTDVEPPSQDNSGEIVLYENANATLNGTVDSVTSNTLADADFASYETGYYIATISEGAGFGQTRIGYSESGSTTMTLLESWGTLPDTSSRIIVSKEGIYHIATCNNYLDGYKNDDTNRVTASTGISLYGNSAECIVAGNTATQTETGFGTWTMVNNGILSQNYFNRFADNIYVDPEPFWGDRGRDRTVGYYISMIAGEDAPGDISTPTTGAFGNMFVDNVISNSPFAFSISGISNYVNSIQLLSVYEFNSGTADTKWFNDDGTNTIDRSNSITAP